MASFFSASKSGSVSNRVQDLQDSFFRRLSTASVASPSASSSGKFTGGEPFTGSTSGESRFILIDDANLVCGGLIGSGGKFCVKLKDDCAVNKHEKSVFEELDRGIYLKGINQDAYCSPCLPTTRLSAEAVGQLMSEVYEDLVSARRRIDVISQLDKTLLTKDDIVEAGETKPPPRFATPFKKTSKPNIRDKFDALMSMVPEEDGVNVESDQEKFTKLFAILMELSTLVENQQMDIDKIFEQSFEISSQLGVPPKGAPPTLWLGQMELRGDIHDIASSLKRKADAASLPNFADHEGRIYQVEENHKKLRTAVKVSFEQVATEFANQSSNPNGTGLSTEQLAKLDEMYTRLSLLENQSATSQPNHLFVKAGKFKFFSMSDVGAWVDKYLPPDCPFGVFVDAYSFLERVKSAKDVGDLVSAVGSMDTRRKANVSADEAIVVEAFQYPLPRCFRGGSSSGNLGSAWLPGIRTQEAWENKSGTRGVKIAIQDNMEGIRFRIDSLIQQRLYDFPEASSLAKQLLSDTVTFITSLIAFISNTFLQLSNAGYPDESAWDLVSKLVCRMFATDCYHDKRGIASELLDSDDHRSMATGILWATFATHQVMQEYLKYTFSDHPSVSGEYTRFLVANAGIAKLAAAEKTIAKLQNLVNALERKVETTEKKATTACSKADEAMKMAKKKKRGGNAESDE